MNNIFITGGTGFLGAELIKELMTGTEDSVFALVRGASVKEAEERLFSLLEDTFAPGKFTGDIKNRIKVFVGDITSEKFGLNEDGFSYLVDNTDIVFSNAAVTELTFSLDEIRRVNVDGTNNVLHFSLLCAKKGRLKKVNHISTAYIVGTKLCKFKESDFNVNQQFNNTYEQSKYEAEELACEYRRKGLDVDIFRPGIILGRHSDGRTTNFKMFYQPLHFFSLELFEKIPAAKDSQPNLINVDTVAKLVPLITRSSEMKNMNYHIVSPESPSLGEVLSTASEYFGFKLPKYSKKEGINICEEYSPVNRIMIEPFIPYLNFYTTFEMTNTLKAIESLDFNFPKFDKENLFRLYEFCDNTGFIRRKNKNVTIR